MNQLETAPIWDSCPTGAGHTPGAHGEEPIGHLAEGLRTRQQPIIFAQPSLLMTKAPFIPRPWLPREAEKYMHIQGPRFSQLVESWASRWLPCFGRFRTLALLLLAALLWAPGASSPESSRQHLHAVQGASLP